MRAYRFLLLAVLGALPRASRAVAEPGTNIHVLAINGGGRPEDNFQSHVQHLRQLLSLVKRAGVPANNVTVFSGDGDDPKPDLAFSGNPVDGIWLLEGTRLESTFGSNLRFENTAMPGIQLHPATRAALTKWFASSSKNFRTGDVLFIYVTDHGREGQGSEGNLITLWGRREELSVRDLSQLLKSLPIGVRVVTAMSQCFSGGFAKLERGCGVFSSTADRMAYGCFPETAGRADLGHAFRLFAALERKGRLDLAHEELLLTDDSPDVPLRSSDVFVTELFGKKSQLDRNVDRWIADLGPGSEPELRLAAKIADTFGLPPTFRLLDLRRLEDQAWAALDAAEVFEQRWTAALHLGLQANLAAFQKTHPLPENKSKQQEFLTALSIFTRQGSMGNDLESLSGARDDLAETRYRLQVREAALMRIRTLLTRLAGRRKLASAPLSRDARTFSDLVACETFSIPSSRAQDGHPDVTKVDGTISADANSIDDLAPGYLGLGFVAAPPGARVTLVRAGPAAKAGLKIGDVILGLGDRPLTHPGELSWRVALAAPGIAISLSIKRGIQIQSRMIVPTAAPLD